MRTRLVSLAYGARGGVGQEIVQYTPQQENKKKKEKRNRDAVNYS